MRRRLSSRRFCFYFSAIPRILAFSGTVSLRNEILDSPLERGSRSAMNLIGKGWGV